MSCQWYVCLLFHHGFVDRLPVPPWFHLTVLLNLLALAVASQGPQQLGGRIGAPVGALQATCDDWRWKVERPERGQTSSPNHSVYYYMSVFIFTFCVGYIDSTSVCSDTFLQRCSTYFNSLLPTFSWIFLHFFHDLFPNLGRQLKLFATAPDLNHSERAPTMRRAIKQESTKEKSRQPTYSIDCIFII